MRFTVILLFVVIAASVSGQGHFHWKAYEDAMRNARELSRPMMLYFHFDGCGACRQMERTTLADTILAEYVNSHFVCSDINTRSESGADINEAYQITIHPTFLFLDESGNESHRIVGVFSPEDFRNHVVSAFDRTTSLSAWQARFDAGERDSSFLYQYTHALRDAHMLDAQTVQAYVRTQSNEDLKKEKNLRYIAEYCLHHFEVFLPVGSREFEFMCAHTHLFHALIEPDQLRVRMLWILNHAVESAIAYRARNTFDSLMHILEPFDTGRDYYFMEMDGRTTGMISAKQLVLYARMEFADQAGPRDEWIRWRKSYLKAIRNDAESLNTFAWTTYERSRDREKLKCALKCATRALRLNYTFNYLDTKGWIHYALGNYLSAMRTAEKAIRRGLQEGTDTTETHRLLELSREALTKQRKPSNCWC